MLDAATIDLAYRLFLNRAPGPAEIAVMQQNAGSLADLRLVFMGAPEFLEAIPRLPAPAAAAAPVAAPPPRRPGSPLDHYFCEFNAAAVMEAFARKGQIASPGLVTNFLGTRISPQVYPALLDPMAGTVEPQPDPGNWHADIAEWAAALRSVDVARGSYRIIELGCGWGCWITNMGVAARSRGLTVDLIGIEGDRNHLDNARETLALNGFAPSEYRLYHGVAGPRPGKAIFPDPEAGNAHWGGEPEFYPLPARLAEAERTPGLQVLDCRTLDDMAAGGIIDLLHIDIQGGETAYVAGNADAMKRLVRRVLVGTHSRAIEGELFAHFLDRGWLLEMERPAIAPPQGGRPITRIDGVQLWRNPALG